MKKTLPCSWKTAVLAAALAAIAGCGSTGTIHGKVSIQGKAVSAGTVIVVGEDGMTVRARIKPDGSYRASLPFGLARIAVDLGGPAGLPPIVVPRLPSNLQRDDKPDRPQTLPVYSDVEKSPLMCKVGRGQQTFDIDLPDLP
jgi:hypothetical protein